MLLRGLILWHMSQFFSPNFDMLKTFHCHLNIINDQSSFQEGRLIGVDNFYKRIFELCSCDRGDNLIQLIAKVDRPLIMGSLGSKNFRNRNCKICGLSQGFIVPNQLVQPFIWVGSAFKTRARAGATLCTCYEGSYVFEYIIIASNTQQQTNLSVYM